MPIEHVVHRDDPLHHPTSVRSSAQPRPREASLGPLPSHPAASRKGPRPAGNLGGPRLASLLLQRHLHGP
jgi:hypothetical protein